MKIIDLSVHIKGTVEGDEGIDLKCLSGIESARQADLTFALDETRLSLAEKGKCSCV